VSFAFLALLLPQAAQAHHRAQLQRFGLLALSNLNSFQETRFSLFGTMNDER